MKKKILILGATLFTLVVLLVAGVALGSPWIIRRVLESVAKRASLTIMVEEVTGSIMSPLELHGLVVLDSTGDTLFGASQVDLAYRVSRLIRGNLAFERVTIDKPHLQITRPQKNTDHDEAIQPNTSIPDVTIGLLDITDGDIYLTTAFPEKSYHVRGMQLNVEDLSVQKSGTALRATVAELRGVLEDPRVELTHFEGVIAMDADTVRIDVPSVGLVETNGSVRGWLLASGVATNHDLEISVNNLSPVDVPMEPTWLPTEPYRVSGRGQVISNDRDGRRITTDSLYIGLDNAPMSIIVRGGMHVQPDGTWSLTRGSLTATRVPTDLLRAVVDTNMVAGTIDGRMTADGSSDDLQIALDASYVDLRDRATSRVVLDGHVAVTEPMEAYLRNVRVGQGRVDLRTAQRFTDAIPAVGAVLVRGTLSGNWRSPVFRGVISHTEAGWPASIANGEIRGIEYANLRIDALQPELVHALSSPEVPLPGVLDGRLELQKRGDSIDIATTLNSAQAGSVEVAGNLLWLSDRLSGSAAFALSNINGKALDSLWPVTALHGSGNASAQTIDGAFTTWRVDATFDSSVVHETFIDRLGLGVRQDDHVITVDSVALLGTGLSASAVGTLATNDSAQSSLNFDVRIDSLEQILAIARQWLPQSPDSINGVLSMQGTVTGSRQSYFVNSTIRGSELSMRNVHTPRISANVGWASATQALESSTQMDSISIGNFLLTDARLNANGSLDSIAWLIQGERPQMGLLYSQGTVIRQNGRNLIQFDSVSAPVGRRTWSLLQPTEIVFHDSLFSVDSLVLRVPGLDARLEVNGIISPFASSRLTGRLENLRLEDAAAFAGQDSTTVGGLVDVVFDVTGTLREPVVNAQIDVVRPRVRANQLSTARSTLSYANGELRGDLRIDNDTSLVAELETRLPVLLQLAPFRLETLDQQLSGSLQTSDASLSLIAPLFPTWRNPDGVFVARANVAGTWSRPIWGGELGIQNGRIGLPDLGIVIDSMNTQLALQGDTVAIERFTATSGQGSVRVTGRIGLRDIANPQFTINATTDRFSAIDLRDYMTMVVTGEVRLTGSLNEPRLTGNGTANRGSISFADVLQKQIVDLRDTLFASYIDTSVIRQEGLDRVSSSELLRRLQIDGLQVNLGNDFWMRSGEGDVQLTGILLVNKDLEIYRVDGTLTAARGNYLLQLAPGVTREFTVTRGTVRYFGTTDLNADLDIDARHTVRTFGGSPVNIFAHLGGTLYQPTVQLSSDIRPAVSDAELISYLLFGSPSVQAFAGQGGTQSSFLFQESVDQFAAALSGQLAQSVVRGLGVPLDYLQIKPGNVSRSFSGTEIALGKQFSLFDRPAFITASPRICPRQSFFSTQNLGASLESRLSGHWSLAASVDPVRVCETAVAPLSTRYQLGVDLIWEKR